MDRISMILIDNTILSNKKVVVEIRPARPAGHVLFGCNGKVWATIIHPDGRRWMEDH